jgi:predicted enzyme related to lactoylglutathione lyase
MSVVTENQPDGTPTWIDLGVPDLDRALDFYGAVFGWEFDIGPAEYGRYTTAYVKGGRVAALAPSSDPSRPGSGGTSTWPQRTATPPRRRSNGPEAWWSTRPRT